MNNFNNFNNLQSLYADNKLVSVDDITIKYNNNEELYVYEISNNIINFDNQFIILCSDISNNPIETKLTNDYIIDETININKIKDLSFNILNINDLIYDLSYNTDININNLKIYSDLQNYDLSLNLNNKIIDVSNNIIIYTDQNFYKKNFIDSSYNFIINRFEDYYNKNWFDSSYNILNNKIIDTSNNIIIYTDQNFYKKNFIDSSYNFIINKFNDYVLTSFLTSNYTNNTNLSTLLNNYVLNTTLNSTLSNYVLTSFLTSNYTNNTNLSTLLNNYVLNTTLNSTLSNYVLTSFLTSNYTNNTNLSTLLNNYVLTSFLTSNYTNNTNLSTLLNNYVLNTTLNSTLSNYVLTSTLNSTLSNYVLTSFLTSNYTNNTNLSTLLNNYALNSTLSNYVLTSYLTSNYTNNTNLLTLLNNYVQTSYLTSNYTDNTNLTSLLNNKLDLSTYNNDQYYLSLKFFSPLSTSNLRKNYFEYADLTSNKYIFFSQNGTNQYQNINFIDDNTLEANKLINYSVGQLQLNTLFHDNALYCYNNWKDSLGGISLTAITGPSGPADTYYIRYIKNSSGLNQITWTPVSSISTSITLPYNITTNNTGYNSASTANFKLTQNGNSINSTGIEFSCVNSDDVNNFYGSFGFNSSGKYPTTSPNYITYPNPYTYIYSRKDLNLFSYNSTTNNITIRIQCLPDLINFWSKCNYNNYNLENVNKIFVGNIDNNSYYNGLNYITFNGDCQFNNMIKVDTIQGYSAINQVKFNNPINLQNNKLINYDLEYQTMIKNTSGSIILKTTTNNVYTTWSCYDESDTGIAMGIYKDNNGNSLAYHTINKNYTFGNNFLTLYKIDYNSNNRHTLVSGNMDINMDVNSTIYTNYLRNSTTGYINCYNLKMMTNIDMNNYNLINYSGGGTSLTSDSIAVNSSNNFLRKGNITRSGVQLYGMSSNCFNLENNGGESSGICLDGDSDGINCYCPCDSGTLISYQDEDSSNSRLAYINNGGSFITVSSKERKHSIREKNNNNVLKRFMKLKVKSYGYKYDFNNDDNEIRKQRKINKSSKQNIGFILEEIFEIFPNTCAFYNNKLDDDLIDDQNIKNKKTTYINKNKLEDEKDIKNMGIDYNRVLLYTIMSVQELNNKLEDENKLLKNKINDMEDKFNKLLNKLNLTI